MEEESNLLNVVDRHLSGTSLWKQLEETVTERKYLLPRPQWLWHILCRYKTRDQASTDIPGRGLPI